MRCEVCDGKGFVVVKRTLVLISERDGGIRKYQQHEPCPECYGSGVAYCCDKAGSSCNLGEDRDD